MNLAGKFSNMALQNEKLSTTMFDDNSKVIENSKQKFDTIIKNIEHIVKSYGGYGSVTIMLDYTFDLFNMNENNGRYYSASEVLRLLKENGFVLKEITDYYDAKDFIIMWNDILPKYPQKISMQINSLID